MRCLPEFLHPLAQLLGEVFRLVPDRCFGERADVGLLALLVVLQEQRVVLLQEVEGVGVDVSGIVDPSVRRHREFYDVAAPDALLHDLAPLSVGKLAAIIMEERILLAANTIYLYSLALQTSP